jgi:hypothetical protein
MYKDNEIEINFNSKLHIHTPSRGVCLGCPPYLTRSWVTYDTAQKKTEEIK